MDRAYIKEENRVSPAPERGADVSPEIRAVLTQQALEAMRNSYAPYSHYNVGAAVLMSSGRIYTGTNVENASYPCGICAERNAVSHAAACGERKIIAIALAGGMDGEAADYCTPCGMCRQVLREFSEPEELYIFSAKSPEDFRTYTLAQLLPESFGPEALGHDA